MTIFCHATLKMTKIVLWGALVVMGLTSMPAIAEDNLPFRPGEKLEYVLMWEAIKAGEAVLEVMPVTSVNGQLSYHFVLKAKTTPFVDVFYKVRNRIDAYADLDMSRSTLYKHDQKEGGSRKNITVDFDWDNGLAQYNNSGRLRDPIELMPGSFDPLSAFYFTRTIDLEDGVKVECPITDGKKNVIGQARVLRRETIETAGGKYDTYVVEPDLKDVGGVFKKSKNAKVHIWVTADERRIPVRIKSKVVIGSFIGELVSAEGLSPDRVAKMVP
jgi:hypothetical protein